MADRSTEDPGAGRIGPVRVVVGAAAIPVAGLIGLARLGGAVAQRLPVVDSALVILDRRGETAVREVGRVTDQVVAAVVRSIVRGAVGDVDLTKLINDNVDLVVIANRIVDGIDLPDIIRESTGSMSSEAVAGVRTQGMRADDAVSGIVDRVLRRAPTAPIDRP